MAATPAGELGRAAIKQKGWLQAHKWLMARRFSQISILALFLLGSTNEISLIKGNLASSEVLGTVPLLDPIVFLQMAFAGAGGFTSSAIIGVLIVTIFYGLIGGRMFCSWVCPLNIVTDAARWTRRKLGIISSTKLKKNTRYFMLAMVMIVAAASSSLAYELVNPVSILHRGILFGFGLGWTVIVGIFAFDVFFSKDGWCGHLCPMGALYSLLGHKSLVRVRADKRNACDDCMECYEVCPEMQVIPPALKKARGQSPVILSSDCTNCGRCIDICDERVFHFGLRT